MTNFPEKYFSSQGFENIPQVLLQAQKDAAQQVCLHLLFSDRQDCSLTYEELFIQASKYGSTLERMRIDPGEVVIIILPHGEDLVAAFYGAILHGAIPSILPYLTEKLQAEFYRSSLQALFAVTRPAAVITYTGFADAVRTASVGSTVRTVILTEEIHGVDLPVKSEEAVTTYQPQGINSETSNIVLLQHSSGTTGLQKGVALTHQAVFRQLESYSQALQLNNTDVVVSWLPLYHDMGLIAGFILPILFKIPLVLLSPFDWVRAPWRLMQAIDRFRGTLCWLPNFAYNFCAQKIRDREARDLDLSSLRAVINCSEPMHWKSHELFYERFSQYGLKREVLSTSYAMAENVFAVTQGEIGGKVNIDRIDRQAFSNEQRAQPVPAPASESSGEANATLQMLSAGKPIAGTRIRILSTRGKILPERQIGEIVLQSDCMLAGYYNRPDLTEKAFQDGWYLTGDLGYLAGGELYVTGRKKDLIIVGGKNIYPQDLEHLASEVNGVHPGRVVAFGIFNENTGTEDIVLVAEIDEDTAGPWESSDADRKSHLEQIMREIRRVVAEGSEVALRNVYLVKRNWLVKTSSGKIARNANKTKYLQETGEGSY